MHTRTDSSSPNITLKYLTLLALCIISSITCADNSRPEIYSDKLYAINILSQISEVSDIDRANIEVREGYVLYTTKTVIRNVTWNRLRLGFFGSQKEASKYIDSFLRGRKDLWIASVTSEEYLKNKTFKDEQLFMKAQDALNNNSYEESAAIYKKIIASNDRKHKASALVSLGEIYERTGDLQAALDVYNQYISLYPGALNINRIKALRKALYDRLHTNRPWVSSGRLSQSVSRHTSTIDNIDPLQPAIYTETNSIITYLNYTGYKNYAKSSIRLKLNGDYDYSLINQISDKTLSVKQLSLAYSTYRGTLALGRQIYYGGGINGLFDGLSFSFTPTAPVEFRMTGGTPVDHSSNAYNDDRYLYSLNIDTRKLIGNTNISGYYVHQYIDSISDREATGMSFNYTGNKLSILSNIDYDLFYNALNYTFINIRYLTKNNVTYNVTFNKQRSPFLSLRNALYGQPEDDIHELLTMISMEELKKLSKERTGSFHSLTLGTVRPINNTLQISADISLSHYDKIPLPYEITGNVPGYRVVVGSQLIGSNLIKNGDLAITSFEYMRDSKNTSGLLKLSTRYPVTRLIEVSPSATLRYTDYFGEPSQWKLFPSLNFFYQVKDRLQLEATAGMEYADPDFTQVPSNRSGYFYEFNYRLKF